MAAGLRCRATIYAHGLLLVENDKMSKSRGNIVRTEPITRTVGADALRYFLLREIVFGQDGSFSYDALVTRFNSDLANGLGNSGELHAATMITQLFRRTHPRRWRERACKYILRKDHRRMAAESFDELLNSHAASKLPFGH